MGRRQRLEEAARLLDEAERGELAIAALKSAAQVGPLEHDILALLTELGLSPEA